MFLGIIFYDKQGGNTLVFSFKFIIFLRWIQMENKSNYELELMRAKKAIDIVAGSTCQKHAENKNPA